MEYFTLSDGWGRSIDDDLSVSRDIVTEQDSLTRIGGKAWNLFEIQKLNISVPKFFVVSSEAPLSDVFGAELIDYVDKHFPKTKWFSVRSSVSAEDGAVHSFAGMFHTELFVSKNDLYSSIKRVQESAYSERIDEYLNQKEITEELKVAVIIQEMIRSESSGVGFSQNPVNGRKEILINSVWGLGEGIVSGELEADVFTVRNGNIECQLVNKSHGYFVKEGEGGVEKKAIEKSQMDQASINNEKILELSGLIEKLADHYGKPQDVEWALQDGEIYILQSRPITKIFDDQSEKIVWDNSNIIESYPGTTLPLTFSFISKMYAAVYFEMLRIMGVSSKELLDYKSVLQNMLGLLKGRVYYNLNSWYEALSLLPGYDINAEFMEKMMGVRESFELPNRNKRKKLLEYLRVGRLVSKMIANLIKLPSERKKFHINIEKVLSEYYSLDLNSLSESKLMTRYLDFETRLTKQWQPPLVNDFFAMIFFGVLEKLTKKYDLREGLHNDLLCGSDQIVSTQHVKLSMELLILMENYPQLKDSFLTLKSTEVLDQLQKYPDVASQFDDFILKFGDRTVGELKLETVTLRQDPSKFVHILQNYLKSGVDPHVLLTNDSTLRKDAEQELQIGLKSKWVRRVIYHRVLRATRNLVSERENLRFERTRGFGVVRQIFITLGQKFASEETIDQPRDIFYLELNEVFDLIKNEELSSRIKETISLRKTEYERFEKTVLPERIETYGAELDQSFNLEKNESMSADSVLQGIGCCPGIVKKQVRVVKDPFEVESLNNDILVTSYTDPGWISLFPSVSGIIVERGSLLSHSAIVSREMGIPCIVGVTGLLSSLKNGDWVEMNGSSGQIKLFNQ